MTKHTAGPWTFRDISIPTADDGLGYIEGPDGIEISHHGSNRRSKEENLVNAQRTLACVNACENINPEAVPLMLKACKRALRILTMDSDMEEDFAPEIKVLRQTIIKAEAENDKR